MMSLRWRRNATSQIKSLGGGTRKIGLSLLACSMLRSLGLPPTIFRHHHLCRSSTLIANIHRLNLFLVLQQPVSSVLAVPSVPVTTALGSTTMAIPATPTKGGTTLLSHIESVKKWGVRGTSSTPSEIIGTLLLIF